MERSRQMMFGEGNQKNKKKVTGGKITSKLSCSSIAKQIWLVGRITQRIFSAQS